ncbi:response regulator [Pontibacter silvestris]|uniref:Response regulator n=1 Tax=Pontibacter silvestris TaxID=2305183 RepID=A0ABW4WRP1_9BACT|nr:response regulator [Pontibacter silvestris]MCC9138171.1 response regulator [Pontibacter silvestris]
MLKRAFIIDDDEISLFLTEAILEEENIAKEYQSYQYAQDALNDIIEGLEVEKIPDIIFLDLNMPLMSGWSFLNRLLPYENQLEEKCSIYILTSSVDIEEEEKAKGYRLVKGFLHKPLEESSVQEIKQHYR